MDYYQVFGVNRNASTEEIRQSLNRLAPKIHPSLLENDEQRQDAHEKMLVLLEAWKVLSDEVKRKKYDTTLPPEIKKEGQVTPGSTTTESASQPGVRDSRKVSSENDYSTFYDEVSKIFGWGELFQKQESITIPESDWGLLAGLVRAHSENKYVTLTVNKPADDSRDWMPKIIYIIENYPQVIIRGKVRDQGEVVVGRTVKDWVNEDDRDKEIRVTYQYSNQQTTLKPGSYLSESFLKRSDRYINGNSTDDYSDYIRVMKKLAQRIANHEGSERIKEPLLIRLINNYGQRALQDVRVEGVDTFSDDDNREWVKPVQIEDFYTRLKEAEAYVSKVEGVHSTPEGTFLLPSQTPGGERI